MQRARTREAERCSPTEAKFVREVGGELRLFVLVENDGMGIVAVLNANPSKY